MDEPRRRTQRGIALTPLLALSALAVGVLAVAAVLARPQAASELVAALPGAATATPATPSLTPLPTLDAPAGPTALPGARIERGVVAPPTHTPTPTLTPTPTVTPTPTETPIPSPRPTRTPEPAVEIEWTQAEKNALSWLCYGEAGGMGVTRVDACLSVISTVRARYAYSNRYSATNVLETITAPGQFNVRIETDRPVPDAEMVSAVEDYQRGARGSCSGYLHFDSASPRANDCVIYGYGGTWLRFY